MVLLERARPLEVLEELAGEAASGRGRLVLLAGEAGVGKTTLARHFAGTLPAASVPTPSGVSVSSFSRRTASDVARSPSATRRG